VDAARDGGGNQAGPGMADSLGIDVILPAFGSDDVMLQHVD
jgi:hypothetical protein